MVREDAPPGKRNPGPDRGGKAGPCTPGPPSKHPRKISKGKKQSSKKTRYLLGKKTETR